MATSPSSRCSPAGVWNPVMKRHGSPLVSPIHTASPTPGLLRDSSPAGSPVALSQGGRPDGQQVITEGVANEAPTESHAAPSGTHSNSPEQTEAPVARGWGRSTTNAILVIGLPLDSGVWGDGRGEARGVRRCNSNSHDAGHSDRDARSCVQSFVATVQARRASRMLGGGPRF